MSLTTMYQGNQVSKITSFSFMNQNSSCFKRFLQSCTEPCNFKNYDLTYCCCMVYNGFQGKTKSFIICFFNRLVNEKFQKLLLFLYYSLYFYYYLFFYRLAHKNKCASSYFLLYI